MASTDGFKFWASYYDALRALGTDRQRSEFMLGLCAYVFDGVEPEFDDPVVRFGYTLVAEQARQSMEISRAAREVGKRGGRPRKEPQKRDAKSTPKRVAKRGAESVSSCVGALAPNTTNSSPKHRRQAPPRDAGAGADAPPPLP